MVSLEQMGTAKTSQELAPGPQVVRLAGGLVLWAAAVFGGWFLLDVIGRWAGVAAEGWFVLVQGVAVAVAVTAVYEMWQRRTRPTRAARLRQFGVGLALGAGLVAAVVAGVWALGGVSFTVSPDPWGGLAWAVRTALLLAAAEEVLFRGLLLRDVEVWTGSWIALAVSSALFGLAHMLGPGASWWDAVLVALEGGALLGALCIVTGGVWAPIGFHVAWNLVQGGVFGVAVSGNEWSGILVAHPSGPAWISGGAFGVEGSLVTLAACAVTTLAILWTARRRRLMIARPSGLGLRRRRG